MIDILVDDDVTASSLPDEQSIRHTVNTSCLAAGMQQQPCVCVRLANDECVRILNRRWRHVDAVTDVLSFPMRDADDEPSEPLGDIVLAWPFVQCEAINMGIDAHAHALHLIVHGTLHLLGYDHIEDQHRHDMRMLETQIMQKLGLHNPWEEKHRGES